jgi:hypothetical protein
MRSLSVLFIVTSAYLTVDAGKTSRVTDIPAARQRSASSAADTTSPPLALATSPIDTTLLLGAWLKAHPGDTISAVPAITGFEDPFCRSAVARTSLGRRTVTRHAMFYIPAPPAGEALPETTELAERACELRTIFLTIPTADSAKASGLADSLARVFDAGLGAHKEGKLLGGRESQEWTGGRTWEAPVTTVVLAIASSVVTITAYAPGSGVEDFESSERRYNQAAPERMEAARTANQSADSALILAGLPSIATDLRSVLAAVRSGDAKEILDASRHIDGQRLPEREPPHYATLLRALRAVHDTAPLVKPSQLAAIMLAADLVLNASVRTVDSDTTALFRSLDSVGIRYENDPLGSVYVNPRPWLWYAYRFDSLGRVGHIAFVELLSAGWSTDAQCRDGPEQFAKIIEHGEGALRRGDKDPMVHYYVGMAYKTIFDLAHEDERNEYVEPKAYESRAEQARLSSIDHFRTALGALAGGSIRREAWNQAIRMMLSRPTHNPPYYCTYD